MNLFQLIIVLILSLATESYGQSKLPRGSITPDPSFKKPVNKSPMTVLRCEDYNASPISGLYYMSPSKEFMYFLAKKAVKVNGKLKTGISTEYNFELYRLNVERFEWTQLMTFRKGDINIIVSHGKYSEGISLLTFSEFQDGCFWGNASGFSTTLQSSYQTAYKNITSKVFEPGRYKVIPSSLGRVVANMDKSVVLEIDPKGFQKRQGVSFMKNTVPIFLDYESRRLLSLNYASKPIQLELRLHSSKEAYKIMKLDNFQKFVREDNRYAKLFWEKESNRIILHATNDWTGTSEKLYKVTLPKKFKGDKVAVYPFFKSETATVMGNSLADRKSLRVALVVDLAKNKVLHRHVPRKGFYVSHATIGPSGKFAYFVVNYLTTGAFHKLFRYDLNRRYYRVLSVKPDSIVTKSGAGR